MANTKLQQQVLERMFALYPEFRAQVIQGLLSQGLSENEELNDKFMAQSIQQPINSIIPIAIAFEKNKIEYTDNFIFSQESTNAYLINNQKYRAKINLVIELEEIIEETIPESLNEE